MPSSCLTNEDGIQTRMICRQQQKSYLQSLAESETLIFSQKKKCQRINNDDDHQQQVD